VGVGVVVVHPHPDDVEHEPGVAVAEGTAAKYRCNRGPNRFLAAWEKVRRPAAAGSSNEAPIGAALATFRPVFFNNMVA
jgi:hypothetical protein